MLGVGVNSGEGGFGVEEVMVFVARGFGHPSADVRMCAV